MPREQTPSTGQDKTALRDRISPPDTAVRCRCAPRSPQALAEHLLAAPEVRRAATVAAYVARGQRARHRAAARGAARLGAPRAAAGAAARRRSRLGRARRRRAPARRPGSDCWSRTGERLGPHAVAGADVVLVPGLAVAPDGMRLGRGGGSYDRALARVPVGTFTCVLLHDDEVGVDVPREPHDRPVTAAVCPAGPDPLLSRSAVGGRAQGHRVRARVAHGARAEGPRQGLAARPQVGLVGVVAAGRVPGDPRQVDPARGVPVTRAG